MEETCLDCGREINGASIETPDGDVYHYECVDVEYPETCMASDVLETLASAEGEVKGMPLFQYLKENPHDPLERSVSSTDELPEVSLTIRNSITIDIDLSRYGECWDVYHQSESLNLTPMLFQAVNYGRALERESPSFVDGDRLYSLGDARVPPEEETDE